MTAPPATAVLYGARCANQVHRGYGTVYATSLGQHRIRSLAEHTCYEIVVSHDGGQTWEVA